MASSAFRRLAVQSPRILRAVAAGGVAVTAAAFASPLVPAPALCTPGPSLPPFGIPGKNQERTLILIKPDGVERGLVGEIISSFEKKGYKLVGMKMETPTKAKAEQNYDGLRSKPFFPGLVAYFSSGPVVALCFEGADAIATGRKMVDEIRYAKSVHYARNVIDGSDSVDGARDEIQFWFSPSELSDYTRAIDSIAY
mmetsp:Transcript_2660/g.3957  ORF Transcript_2660/g.3957 Transcript_2660/m.3957 type:complete len:197 (+) Transcript_2660:18-608(+)